MAGYEVIKDVYSRKAEEKEALRKTVLKSLFGCLSKLREEVPFEEAYIFGSVTKPYRFSSVSDVDVAFRGLDKHKLYYATTFLSSCLRRDANILDMDEVHFRDKILREGLRWKKESEY